MWLLQLTSDRRECVADPSTPATPRWWQVLDPLRAAAPGTPPTYDPAAETALHSSPSPPQLILVLLCDPQHEQSVIPLVAYIAPAASPRCSCAGELVVWVPHLCNTVRRAFLVDALPAGQQL